MALARRFRRPAIMAVVDETDPFQVAPALLDASRSVSLRIGGADRRTIPVTSAISGEGKTTIAMALSLIQATDYRRRVTLLEMDFENPSLANRLGLKPRPGLHELVDGQATVAQVLQPAAERISVITAGAPGWSPSRLAMSLINSDILSEVAGRGDVVVADLPGLLTCGYSYLLAGALLEPAVVVVRAGITPLPRVRQAIERLSVEPALLLNGAQSSLPRWLRLIIGL